MKSRVSLNYFVNNCRFTSVWNQNKQIKLAAYQWNRILLNICWNSFKDDTVVSDFSDYCYSSFENENTLAIEKRNHFTQAVTERCSLNLCLASIINLWRSQILKKIHGKAFLVIFQRSSSQLKNS